MGHSTARITLELNEPELEAVLSAVKNELYKLQHFKISRYNPIHYKELGAYESVCRKMIAAKKNLPLTQNEGKDYKNGKI